MARIGFEGFKHYLADILAGWKVWGDDFTVGDLTRADVEALLATYSALDDEISRKLLELEVLRAQREQMALDIEALGTRTRYAVLTRFAPRSPQAVAIPIFGRRHAGAPSNKTLAQRASAQKRREAGENQARESLKAELRAELEGELAQEKARLP